MKTADNAKHNVVSEKLESWLQWDYTIMPTITDVWLN